MNEKARYTPVNDEQQGRIDNLREAFSEMYEIINQMCKPSRETSLATTKLEEAQFWAIKGISREGGNNANN